MQVFAAHEQIQFTFLLSQFLSVAEQVFNDFKTGVTDDAPLERTWIAMEHILRSPGGRAFWEIMGNRVYPPDFAQFIDSRLLNREEPHPKFRPATRTVPPSYWGWLSTKSGSVHQS